MKKLFTIIEMLVVIVILGVLAAIVIPNVADMRKDATTSHIQANISMLQTAVDRYALEHNDSLPTAMEPTLGKPELILIDDLYPKYIKKKVDYKAVQGQRYWVDMFGKVWGATVDSPNQIQKSDQYVQWDRDENVLGYQIYEVNSNQTTGAAKLEKIRFLSSIKMEAKTNRIELNTGDKEYLFSSIDKYGLESAPVGPEYLGFQDGFVPLTKKKGEFTFEIISQDPMQILSYRAWEEKPEGSSINYQFSIKDSKKNYNEFNDNFPAKETTDSIKVKVKMDGQKALPSLLNFHVYFAYPQDEYIGFKKVPAPTKVLDECANGKCQYFTPEGATGSGNYVAIPLPTEEPSVTVIDGYAPFNPMIKYYCEANGTYYDTATQYDRNCGTAPPVVACSDCGGVLFLDRDKAPIPNPEPIPANNPHTKVVNMDKETVKEEPQTELFAPLREKGWTTVQTLKFFAHSPDGTRVRWTRAEISDKQPENTRIVYSYANSNGFYTEREVDSVDKLSESRDVIVSAYMQVKDDFVGKAADPELYSIKLYNEKGVADLSTVKPSVLLQVEKSNNAGNDSVSVDSKLTWKYETHDPRNLDITAFEWTGPKQEQYTTPGTYKVGVRVKNSSNYWSDWNYLTLNVKAEKPVADFKTSPTFIETSKTITWDTSLSIDPDGDAIVKYEWDGFKKDKYTLEDLGSHTVRLRIQDSEGNWSDWKERTIRVYEEGEVAFSGLADAAFDGDPTTKVGLPVGASTVTWEGILENRLIKVAVAGGEGTRIEFYNENNQRLDFITHDNYLFNGNIFIDGSRSVVVPEGATKMTLWNRYYGSTLSDITILSDKKRPTNISDVNYVGRDSSIDFSWTNPSLSDFKEVTFYLTDNTYAGKSTTSAFTHKPLLGDTEYSYKATIVDQSGNRSPFIYFNAKTTKPSIAWKGLGAAAFDGDTTTKTSVGVGTTAITWDGTLDGRLIKVDIAGGEGTRIQFYDAAGKMLPFINHANSNFVNDLTVNGTVSVVAPEGAAKMTLWNRYYGSTATDIRVISDETRPEPVTNVVSSGSDYAINFNWSNPNISDMKEIAFYQADNTFMGKSTGTTFSSKPLLTDTDYVHKIVVVDNSGYRSTYVNKSGRTTKPAVAFKGLAAGAFDGDSTTYVSLGGASSANITWDGNLSGKTVSLNINSGSAEGTVLRFYDANGAIMNFTNKANNTTVSSLTIRGTSQVIAPEGAVKFNIYNRYYGSTVYDIVVLP